MPNVMDQRIVINGTSGAWAYVLEKNSGTGKYEVPSILGTVLTKQLRWDNIKGLSLTLVRPDASTAAAADEFVQITRADGSIIEFIKEKLTLDGATGEVKGGTGVTASGGTKGTIAFTANQSDIDSAEYVAYMNKLQNLIGATFLVCIPLGFNYIKRKAGATTGDVAPVGYAFMLATLAADLTHATDNYTPAAIAFSFASKKLAVTGADFTDPHAAFDLGASAHEILVPDNISGGTPTGVTLNPPSVAVHTSGTLSADFQKLLDGEVLIKIGA